MSSSEQRSEKLEKAEKSLSPSHFGSRPWESSEEHVNLKLIFFSKKDQDCRKAEHQNCFPGVFVMNVSRRMIHLFFVFPFVFFLLISILIWQNLLQNPNQIGFSIWAAIEAAGRHFSSFFLLPSSAPFSSSIAFYLRERERERPQHGHTQTNATGDAKAKAEACRLLKIWMVPFCQLLIDPPEGRRGGALISLSTKLCFVLRWQSTARPRKREKECEGKTQTLSQSRKESQAASRTNSHLFPFPQPVSQYKLTQYKLTSIREYINESWYRGISSN